jgi:hypothetical protein
MLATSHRLLASQTGLPVLSGFLVQPPLPTYGYPSLWGGTSLGSPQDLKTRACNQLHRSDAERQAHCLDGHMGPLSAQGLHHPIQQRHGAMDLREQMIAAGCGR